MRSGIHEGLGSGNRTPTSLQQGETMNHHLNVLVTGANGYLGGWTQKLLTERGHTLYPFNSHEQALNYANPSMTLTDAVKVADVVIHLAWYSSAGDEHRETHHQCLSATNRLLREVVHHGKSNCRF